MLDKLLAIIGLAFFSPVMVVVSILIKLTSAGPVLYVAPRVGRHGRLFKFYKFRTMHIDADKEKEGSVTVLGDRRISFVGNYLRRFKLDELPSLINVLKGDMSFVGPRPDVPGYADKLTGEARRILELRPGITGPATLKYAREERLLAKVDNPKQHNDEVIFPDKVRINLDYLDNMSLANDLKYIWQTAYRAIFRKYL